MITVEKAIKDNRTKNAIGSNDPEAKKSRNKKILIGVAVVGAAYFGYRLFKMSKGNATVQPVNQ